MIQEPRHDGSVWTASDLAEDPHAAKDKASRVQAMFSAIARSYDLNNRLHSFGRDQAWRRRAVALSAVKATDAVLDVACGTGDLAMAFARAGAASVTGVDFAPPMLEIARVKAERHAWAKEGARPRYQDGDATDLEFSPASFDVVSIAFGIRNVTDPHRALSEFRRILRPGGRLVILEFSEPTQPILRWFSALYTRHIMPHTASWLARDRSGAYRYLPRSISTFLDREELAGAMAAAGFEGIVQHPLTFGICVAYVGYTSSKAEHGASDAAMAPPAAPSHDGGAARGPIA